MAATTVEETQALQVQEEGGVPSKIEEHIQHLAREAPALLHATLALAQAQVEKIRHLQTYKDLLVQEQKTINESLPVLTEEGFAPKRRNEMQRRLSEIEETLPGIDNAIAALERGYIPIPYLDHTPSGGWSVDNVPYRILKEIKERNLDEIFRVLGIVEPQDETFRTMTLTDTTGSRNRRVTVMGRVLSEQVLPARGRRDPILIGGVRIGSRMHWFMVAVWNDSLQQLEP